MEKIPWDGPKQGREGIFLANLDLADILGRTDLDFENFHSFRFLDSIVLDSNSFPFFLGLLSMDRKYAKHVPKLLTFLGGPMGSIHLGVSVTGTEHEQLQNWLAARDTCDCMTALAL